MCFII
jgi:aurora kinase